MIVNTFKAEPFVANSAERPCADAHTGAVGETDVGPARVSVVDVNTNDNSGAHGDAAVTTARIAVSGLPVITARNLTSQADASCRNGTPRLRGDSDVEEMTIGGTTIELPEGPATFNAGVGKVHLNEQSTSSAGGEQRLTQRALRLVAPSLGVNIVIAESVANVHGDPCGRPAPQCSDGADNADAEDTLADAADPGCHTDGNPNNSGSYDPNDNDETDKPQCSNGGDDDGDGKVDAADPGCHTDGNPGNPGSYDPGDDDETDRPQCSDGADNADPEDEHADAADPGCHTDGNPGNPNSYDPNDNDETDKPRCSNGGDDDGDGKIDADDPGCHTDGDPKNPGSYDPNDDDETDKSGPRPECSNGADDDADSLTDAKDPGCHTDGDPNNPDSYDPNDNQEYDDTKYACSDGIDNEGDGKIDEFDPGCHSDGNVDNPHSWDPRDDDESDDAK